MKKRIFQEEVPEQAKHSESDKTTEPSAERLLVSEPQVEESSLEAKQEDDEETMETNVSLTGSNLVEIQELNTNNMA